MRRFILSIFLTLSAVIVLGQATTSEYTDAEADELFTAPQIMTDQSVFTIPLESGRDMFSRLSAFNFSSVRYLRRGYDYRHSQYSLNNIDLRDASSGRPYYNVIGALRKLGTADEIRSGFESSVVSIGGLQFVTSYDLDATRSRSGNWASFYTSDKYYRYGLDAGRHYLSEDSKFSYSLGVTRRWGRDSHVKGVYTDEGSVYFTFRRQIDRKHTVSMFLGVSPSEEGLRSATTEEAYKLTGNRLYNPSWGVSNGLERNSKVSGEFQPFVLFNHGWTLDDKSKISTSFSSTFGRNYYTGLTWYNAENPNPDYWNNMPSKVANGDISKALHDKWRSGSPSVSQVYWDDLVRRNRDGGGEAIYVSEDRAEDVLNFQLASQYRRKVSENVSFVIGIRARRDRKQLYKRVRDLLGAEYLIDTEQYLVDDNAPDAKRINDLRNPDRKVGEGERFGYHYDILLNEYCGFGGVRYMENHYNISAGIQFGRADLRRRGNYEKELFAGKLSYGDAPRKVFDIYRLRFSGGYSISRRQSIDGFVIYSEDAPFYDNIYFDPRNSNLSIERPATLKTTSGELSYNLTFENLKLKTTGFYTRFSDESDISRFYDDISRKFTNVILEGIDRLHYGIEISGDYRISRSLTFNFAASKGYYYYDSNPSVNIYDASSGEVIYPNSHSYISGYLLGGTPQVVASGELRYTTRSRWTFSLAANYCDENYITISPTRRMQRITDRASSREMFDQYTRQEKFSAATTLNMFLMKSFQIFKTDCYALLSVNNILDRRDIVYSGYEQSRMHRSYGEASQEYYYPFDSKYLYSYGRTYYLCVSFNF